MYQLNVVIIQVILSKDTAIILQIQANFDKVRDRLVVSS